MKATNFMIIWMQQEEGQKGFKHQPDVLGGTGAVYAPSTAAMLLRASEQTHRQTHRQTEVNDGDITDIDRTAVARQDMMGAYNLVPWWNRRKLGARR